MGWYSLSNIVYSAMFCSNSACESILPVFHICPLIGYDVQIVGETAKSICFFFKPAVVVRNCFRSQSHLHSPNLNEKKEYQRLGQRILQGTKTYFGVIRISRTCSSWCFQLAACSGGNRTMRRCRKSWKALVAVGPTCTKTHILQQRVAKFHNEWSINST